MQARAGSDRGLSGDELAAIATSNTGRATRRMADDCWRVRLRSAMRDGAVMKRWGSPQRLAKTIVFFEPPPSVWDEETYLAYRSQAIQARKRRSRLRWSVGVIPALAALIIITVAAAVLLAVIMFGAIVAHLTVLGGSPAPAAVLLVLSAAIAYLRKPQQ